MHDVANEFQDRAQSSPRMENAEINRRKTPAFEKRNGQSVSQSELHERRRRRGEIVRTGFAGLRQRKHDIGGAAKRTGSVSGHGN